MIGHTLVDLKAGYSVGSVHDGDQRPFILIGPNLNNLSCFVESRGCVGRWWWGGGEELLRLGAVPGSRPPISRPHRTLILHCLGAIISVSSVVTGRPQSSAEPRWPGGLDCDPGGRCQWPFVRLDHTVLSSATVRFGTSEARYECGCC